MLATRRAHGSQRSPRGHGRRPTLALSLATLQVLLMLVLADTMATQQRQHLL
jgi:hypothetical protein